MIAVDTNRLVYAHRQDALFHQQAARRVAEVRKAAPRGQSLASPA
jgi:predicted nucleic acid-binding protein